MRQSGGGRPRRQVIWGVVGAFCAVLLPVTATAQGAHPGAVGAGSALAVSRTPTSIQGFSTGHATIRLGRVVEDHVVIVPRARRVVAVQARRPGSSRFVTQSTGHSAADGRFRAVYRPSTGGVWRFRLVVRPDATRGGASSAARLVTVLDRTAPGAVTGVTVSGVTVGEATLSWVNPKDQDFTGVTIRRAVGPVPPTTATDGDPVVNSGPKLTTFTDTGLTDSTEYSYALFAHDGSSNFAHAAPATLRTARLAVTALGTTSVVRTTVSLAWTNPTDDAFTGAVVRRAVGPTAPASVNDGTDVRDVLAPESTITDTGLTPDTQYSYAVFAHDGEFVAAAATLTVTTRSLGTDALLKVNPLEGTGANVTVDTSVSFDASDSLAADGTTLVAWSVDYGDGTTPDSFTSPFGPADVLNTTHTFANAGDRTVTLSVRDSDGDTATDTVLVHVFTAPKVSVSSTTSSPQVGSPVTFEVKAETPPGTAITSYEMDVSGDETFFLADSSAPPPTLKVTFTLPGTYTIDFTVTNDAGGTANATQLVIEVT